MLDIGEELLLRIEYVVWMTVGVSPWKVFLPHERFIVIEEGEIWRLFCFIQFCEDAPDGLNRSWWNLVLVYLQIEEHGRLNLSADTLWMKGGAHVQEDPGVRLEKVTFFRESWFWQDLHLNFETKVLVDQQCKRPGAVWRKEIDIPNYWPSGSSHYIWSLIVVLPLQNITIGVQRIRNSLFCGRMV